MPQSLTAHAQRVTRLYRGSLKALMNWTVHRDLFITEGFALRARFDKGKLAKDPRLIEKIVREGEAELKSMQHPDPYTSTLPRGLIFFPPPRHPRAPLAPHGPCRPRPPPTWPLGPTGTPDSLEGRMADD